MENGNLVIYATTFHSIQVQRKVVVCMLGEPTPKMSYVGVVLFLFISFPRELIICAHIYKITRS